MYLDVDAMKCTGCRVCLTVCSLYHFKEVNPKKAALNIDAKFPKPGHYEVRVCNQCGTCASVCPVEAISGEKKKPHEINQEICIHCGSCYDVCKSEAILVE